MMNEAAGNEAAGLGPVLPFWVAAVCRDSRICVYAAVVETVELRRQRQEEAWVPRTAVGFYKVLLCTLGIREIKPCAACLFTRDKLKCSFLNEGIQSKGPFLAPE